jgi:quercetin dioxygenase-like cupin family protein
MRMRTGVIALALFAAAAGSGLVLAREPESAGKIESQQLFVKELAGDPSKEVNAQSYTFPPGAILPWHIHPDADEIAYIIEGTFTFQRAGEEPKVLHAGEADYVEPKCRASRHESQRCAGEAVRRAHQA